MHDDPSKLRQKRGVRDALIEEELVRLRGYLDMVVQSTPYGAKRLAYTPSLTLIAAPSLLADFVARCRSARIDLTLVAGSSRCDVLIHAIDAGPTPAGTSPASCTRPLPHRTA